MPYKVSYRSSFRKDLKSFKNDGPLNGRIGALAREVLENPGIGTGYGRDMMGLYKVSFGERPQYRLIYRIYHCCQDTGTCYFKEQDDIEACSGGVEFVFIKTREDCTHLYKKDRDYFDATAVEGLEPA